VIDASDAERSKCLRCEIMSSKEHYRAAAHFFTKVFSFSKTKRHEYWEDAPLIRQHGPMWSWLSCLVRRSFIISLVLTGSTDACLIITSRHASLGVSLVSVRQSVRLCACVCCAPGGGILDFQLLVFPNVNAVARDILRILKVTRQMSAAARVLHCDPRNEDRSQQTCLTRYPIRRYVSVYPFRA